MQHIKIKHTQWFFLTFKLHIYGQKIFSGELLIKVSIALFNTTKFI